MRTEWVCTHSTISNTHTHCETLKPSHVGVGDSERPLRQTVIVLEWRDIITSGLLAKHEKTSTHFTVESADFTPVPFSCLFEVLLWTFSE